MLKNLILKAIRGYQSNGGSKRYFNTECNFEPTCSEYTHQAISSYGTIKGIKLGLSRIKKCSDPDCIERIKDPLI
ncbi:membrane protein insertion efficiency factor YidD [Thalassotalea psychrophila]|uniref:Membrane protein insertion efficiency factor YidD n=1 Tax=Thalassotalea psychrophila TaxID=3065647 RepID=A0ABY9TXI4_9GAMM|nr:membrane protein insertion efficiency factor YidD [Colwelliaceae bacterium SQ149]